MKASTQLLCYTISGATRPIYSPDPYDVGGRFLEAEISSTDGISRVSTTGPIDPGLSFELDRRISKMENNNLSFLFLGILVSVSARPPYAIKVHYPQLCLQTYK